MLWDLEESAFLSMCPQLDPCRFLNSEDCNLIHSTGARGSRGNGLMNLVAGLISVTAVACSAGQHPDPTPKTAHVPTAVYEGPRDLTFKRLLPQRYKSSFGHRDELFQAVELANLVLHRSGHRLRAVVFPVDRELLQPTEIAVVMATRTGQPPCFVPRKHPSVIIVDDAYAQFLSRVLRTETSFDLTLGTTELLSVLLLHELGHIALGHHLDQSSATPTGAPAPSPESSTSQTTVDLRTLENEADGWAATMIRSALRDSNYPARAVAARVHSRTLVQARLSLQEKRRAGLAQAPQAGASDPKGEYYDDPTTTHPNTELRFLTLDHLVNANQDNGTGLQHFHDVRSRKHR